MLKEEQNYDNSFGKWTFPPLRSLIVLHFKLDFKTYMDILGVFVLFTINH